MLIRFGTEQHWQGILDADSYPNNRYQTIARMGGEVSSLSSVSLLFSFFFSFLLPAFDVFV